MNKLSWHSFYNIALSISGYDPDSQ